MSKPVVLLKVTRGYGDKLEFEPINEAAFHFHGLRQYQSSFSHADLAHIQALGFAIEIEYAVGGKPKRSMLDEILEAQEAASVTIKAD